MAPGKDFAATLKALRKKFEDRFSKLDRKEVCRRARTAAIKGVSTVVMASVLVKMAARLHLLVSEDRPLGRGNFTEDLYTDLSGRQTETILFHIISTKELIKSNADPDIVDFRSSEPE